MYVLLTPFLDIFHFKLEIVVLFSDNSNNEIYSWKQYQPPRYFHLHCVMKKDPLRPRESPRCSFRLVYLFTCQWRAEKCAQETHAACCKASFTESVCIQGSGWHKEATLKHAHQDRKLNYGSERQTTFSWPSAKVLLGFRSAHVGCGVFFPPVQPSLSSSWRDLNLSRVGVGLWPSKVSGYIMHPKSPWIFPEMS